MNEFGYLAKKFSGFSDSIYYRKPLLIAYYLLQYRNLFISITQGKHVPLIWGCMFLPYLTCNDANNNVLVCHQCYERGKIAKIFRRHLTLLH